MGRGDDAETRVTGPGEAARRVTALLVGDKAFMAQLTVVAALDLPDCWVGAGAIRNRVWDALQAIEAGTFQETDVDVVFFDRADLSIERETALEQRLRAQMPELDWQVRNQARMHLRNRDAAYRDTADALRHWPETATAVAARLSGTEVELLAPFGLDDLLGMIARPTPAFASKMEIFTARKAAKGWNRRWPAVRFES